MHRFDAPTRRLRHLLTVLLAVLLVATLAACDDDGGDDTPDMGTDVTDTRDTDEPDTTDTGSDVPEDTTDTTEPDTADATDATDTSEDVDVPPAGIDATFTFVNLLDEAPLPGLEMRIGATTATTDASGSVTFQLMPGVPFQANLTSADDIIRQHYLYDTAPDEDVTYRYALTTEETLGALANALGYPLESNDGILSVRVRDADSRDSIANMTITTNGSYDDAIVADAAAMGGLSLGNVTQPDSLANVTFINHASGPVSPRFEHPEGYTCLGRDPVGVVAEAVAISTYDCEIIPIDLSVTVVDFVTGDPLAGVDVGLDTQSVTTDASGTAQLTTVPNAALELSVTGTDLRDHLFYVEAPGASGAITVRALTDTAVTTLETDLGVTVDDSDGIFTASVADATSGEPIPDTTISVTTASDLQVVFDDAATSGVSAGDTTLDSATTASTFFNVAAGPVSPTFEHPFGYTCDGAPDTVDVPAGTYVFAAYECSFIPVNVDVNVVDLVSNAAQANITIEVADQTVTTDANGLARVVLPANAVLEWTLTGANIRDHHFYRRSPGFNAMDTLTVATNSSVTTLEGAFAQPFDSADGVLAVTVYDVETGASIGAMTLGLDASAFDLQLIANSQAPSPRLSEGDTTRQGSRPASYFVNVAAGQVSPTFAHPWGFTCSLGSQDLEVPAGAWVEARFECDFNRVSQTVRLQSFVSSMALGNVTVSSLLQSGQTDGMGEITLDLPVDQNLRLVANGMFLRPTVIYTWPRNDGEALGFSLATEPTLDQLEMALGVTVSNSDSLVIAALADATTRAPVEGVTVDLDGSYEATFVTDAMAMSGLSAGNTTLTGSASNVVFVNTTPTAATTLSFTDTNGARNCQGTNPLPVTGGTFVISQYLCN